ncbi:MAG: stage 0 sporulation family protein [bacterium]
MKFDESTSQKFIPEDFPDDIKANDDVNAHDDIKAGDDINTIDAQGKSGEGSGERFWEGSEKVPEKGSGEGSERSSERSPGKISGEDSEKISGEVPGEGSGDEDLVHIVGVQIDLTGKVYDYLLPGIDVKYADYCIVEMDKGLEMARVHRPPVAVRRKQVRKPLKKVIRKATPEDMEQSKRNNEKGQKALSVCQKKIAERGLPMKLVKVKYSFDCSKAVFYFTAEGRVDFRDLVKDLAGRFKTRIEMRQIGVRDEARIITGFGCCGRQLCCSLFLREFEPVSIRMAKDQCLTLNPGKISGICGRLMCCLVYEASLYEEIRRKLPKLGERVLVNNEEAKVMSFDVLKELAFVELPDGRVLKVKGSDIQRIKADENKKSSKKPSRSERPDVKNHVAKPGKLPKG